MKNVKEIIKEKNKELASQTTGCMSVSKLIGYLHKEFEKEKMAKQCSTKGFNDPDSKYFQMTPQAILEAWDAKAAESCRYGRLSDSYIEMNLEKTDSLNESLEEWKLNNNYDYDMRLHGNCDGFDQFYKILKEKTDYEYVAREEKLFIKSLAGNFINGRFDCLFYSPSKDRYLIVDWKTTETIDKENKWEKMFGPLYDKDACTINEYTVQIQMYKKALVETYELCREDQIDTYICQFSQGLNALGTNYMIHKENFPYNSIILNNVIDFAYKKQEMQK